MSEEKKKSGWFSKIATANDALKVIKDATNLFFGIAALLVALSFVVGFDVLYDAAIYVGCGIFVRKYKSRAAAVILLVLSLAEVGVSVANKAGANLGGGSNVILGLIVLYAAVRAVEATFKLRGRFAGAEAPVRGDT